MMDDTKSSAHSLKDGLSAQSTRKKKIFIGLGILLVIGVILAIALPLGLKSSDDGPSPARAPPTYNPYTADLATMQFSDYAGVITLD